MYGKSADAAGYPEADHVQRRSWLLPDLNGMRFQAGKALLAMK
jgi:hypothetical protein